MLPEIMQKNSVQKLVGMLSTRYGLGFKLSSMIAADDMDLAEMKVERRGSSLHIPICARGKFLATAIVSGATSLSEGDVSAVSEMVKLVLEPALFSLYLKRQEENQYALLNGALSESAFDDGSTQMDENIATLTSRYVPESESPDRPEFSTPVLLLEAFNPVTIAKVATHIHEIGERWAMLRYTDVRSQVKCVNDLKELGAMTLVVDDILNITLEEQELLAEYAKTGSSVSEPLLLVGMTNQIEDLILRGLVAESFFDVSKNTRVELDRLPVEFSKMKDAIELMLDRKALLH